MNYQSILIVTYGRSGSTLLQGVINSIEGCLIRGENNNFCFPLFKAYQSILKAKEKAANVVAEYPATVVNHPWYGAPLLDENLFLVRCQELVKDLLLADQNHSPTIECYGFKERYTYPEILDEFEEYIQFLSKIFPNLGLIFNTRNLDSVLQSGWWRERDIEQSKQILLTTESRFDQCLKKYKNSFHICYEDIINKSKNLEDMFDFLGATYSKQKIDLVLGQKHSYDFRQERLKRL